MSINDGKQLLVFGLSFAQHDNRKMQQLLRHYDKLPDNPGSRASLFVELNKVARELMTDESAQDQIQQLTDWMTKGGDFPFGVAPTNPGNEARPAQATNNGHQPGLYHTRPFLDGIQGYRGPGRTLSGQQSDANESTWHRAPSERPAANLGRQYGRGRTIGGDWEENDNMEGEENEGEEDQEEGMNTSMEEEDEDMHDPFGGFPQMAGQGQFDGFAWRGNFTGSGHTFAGRGRTLNDPQQQDSPTVADNEDGAAGSMGIDGQVPDQQQNRPEVPIPGQFMIAVDAFHNPPGHHEDTNSSNREDLEEELYENDASMQQGEPDDEEEIECPICLEDYPRSRFPKRPTITEFCDHPDKACLNCLDSSITAVIERGALHLLACPICPQKLSRRDVKEYANQAVYKRYKYLKDQSEIPGHYISCTNPVCGGSQPHESEDPMMTCNHCNFATCVKHRRPWHEGQTCQEFDLDDAQIERLEEEEATAKLLSREATSICPKCGQGVTKSEGCDHMRCQCGQEWCYVVSNLVPKTLPSLKSVGPSANIPRPRHSAPAPTRT